MTDQKDEGEFYDIEKFAKHIANSVAARYAYEWRDEMEYEDAVQYAIVGILQSIKGRPTSSITDGSDGIRAVRFVWGRNRVLRFLFGRKKEITTSEAFWLYQIDDAMTVRDAESNMLVEEIYRVLLASRKKKGERGEKAARRDTSIIVLRHIFRMSLDEIAEKLAMPRDSVKKFHQRAMAAIQYAPENRRFMGQKAVVTPAEYEDTGEYEDDEFGFAPPGESTLAKLRNSGIFDD